MSWSRILDKEAVAEWRRLVAENKKKEQKGINTYLND